MNKECDGGCLNTVVIYKLLHLIFNNNFYGGNPSKKYKKRAGVRFRDGNSYNSKKETHFCGQVAAFRQTCEVIYTDEGKVVC